MNRKRVLLATLGLAPAMALLAQAPSQPAASHVMAHAKELKYGDAGPMFPKGMVSAVIAGDPGKDTSWVIRAKMPAGYKIPAHWHPNDENVTVLSGTVGMGMGDKLDEKASHMLTAGDFMQVPASAHHYAWAKTEAVIQVHATGPFAINYINPSDDPRNAAQAR